MKTKVTIYQVQNPDGSCHFLAEYRGVKVITATLDECRMLVREMVAKDRAAIVDALRPHQPGKLLVMNDPECPPLWPYTTWQAIADIYDALFARMRTTG
jgi:hypothetical protein